MTYRDSFEKCPRCGVDLADARSARACPSCGGLWVDEGVLTEMIQDMTPGGPLGRLQLAVLAHGDPPIGCPSCGDKMQQSVLLQIPIERCPKHGVWFDRNELGNALYRTSHPDVEPLLAELPSREPRRTANWIDFEISEPDELPRATKLYQDVIKIGRADNSHVRLRDSSVARMHAIIDATANVVLVDLGSTFGTLVNGERIDKHILRSGDQIQLGNTRLAVTFGR